MFEPTIKYKRVDQVQQVTQSLDNLTVKEEQTKPEEPKSAADTQEGKGAKEQDTKTATEDPEKEEPKEEPKEAPEKKDDNAIPKKEPTIEVDPSDDERILITLGSGKQYTADRYCPHAGADLTYLGEVAEDEYPPEIGPVLLCTLHYWEFGLDKGGRSGGGWASLNACPHQNECKKDEKLDW